MPSCMSKYRFVRVRISFLKSKIMPGTWRPLEADPGGQQVQLGRYHLGMPSCTSKYRFVRVSISILKSKIILDTSRLLEADP